MMCLEATWFVAAFHSTPMHDPGATNTTRRQLLNRAPEDEDAWGAHSKTSSSIPELSACGICSFETEKP